MPETMPLPPPPPDPATKLPKVGTTIFTVMSQLAAEHHAVNLRSAVDQAGCAGIAVNPLDDRVL